MVRAAESKILGIVAELAHNDINKDVVETEIVTLRGLSEFEVRNILNELEWMHLAKEALPRASRADFRLWNVTDKGV